MNTQNRKSLHGNFVSRQSFLLILYAALDAKSYKFARQAALTWLAIYPGDLGVNHLLAKALLGEGKIEQAGLILERVTRYDPEYAEAWQAMAELTDQPDFSGHAAVNAFALGKSAQSGLPEWGQWLRESRAALAKGEYDLAEANIYRVMGKNLDLPLAAVTHLRISLGRKDDITIYRLAGLYHARWPDCLQFALCLAQTRMVLDDEPNAVNLLHQCVSNDAAGQVAERIWGKDHRYKALWPDALELLMDLPIPAEVAGRLGWNQLGMGPISSPAAAVEPQAAAEPESTPAPEPLQNKSTGLQSLEETEFLFPDGSNDGFPGAVDSEEDLLALEMYQLAHPSSTADAVEPEEVSAGARIEEPAGQSAALDGLEGLIDNIVVGIQKLRADLNGKEAAAEGAAESAGELAEDESEPPLIDGESRLKESEIPAAIPEPRRKRSKEVNEVQLEMERLAKKLKKTGIARADGRYPTYVLFSTKAGLVKQYGTQTAMLIIQELKSLAAVVMKRPGWSGMVFLPDDIDQLKPYGMQPVDGIDPWKLKLALADLDQKLGKKGAMIGAVTIVGGPDVVPFHRLPNPTDDSDIEVPSDNPYGTLDSNYFVPEWPVGRLPGEKGQDAGLLLEQIRRAKEYHSQFKQEDAWWKRFFYLWSRVRVVAKRIRSTKGRKYAGNFGYTAAVWKRSSQAVYRPIGEGRSMLVCPPDFSGSFTAQRITDANLCYYNLHGLADSGEWYGQRDVSDRSAGPDYPVALSTRDLVKNGRAPNIIFSEACYGGLVQDKTEDQSLVLKFLSIGSQAIAGSTVVAYGSVAEPLIGADLLGYLFWENLKEGYSAGEALMRAKIELAREMHKRQGFLDGEDQKTLISFVLYGDPLAKTANSNGKAKKLIRSLSHPAVKTVCELTDQPQRPEGISRDTLRDVKQMVEEYLPGLGDAIVSVSEEHEVNESELQAALNNGTRTKSIGPGTGRSVVTVSKQIRSQTKVHKHYARATVDANGKVVKLAVSR